MAIPTEDNLFQPTPLHNLVLGSTLYGRGVFACQHIADDEEIGVITGERIDDPEYYSNYCIELGPELSLEPESPWRYLNHSCEPNCLIASYEEEDLGGLEDIYLFALRDIAPGEQLVIDYAWPADAAVPCLCGSPACRGWIVDPQELHLVEDCPPKTLTPVTTLSDSQNKSAVEKRMDLKQLLP